MFSTARFIRQGYVDWALFAPSVVLALVGSMCGTWLQHHTPAVVLKYLLLVVLPVVAFITLRTHKWPDEPEPLDSKLRKLIVWAAAFIIGGYDGYYGPGTGTFLMIIFVRFAKLDTRHAAGGVKVINLASNFGSLFTALQAGYVLVGVGLISAVASILGALSGGGAGHQKRQQDRKAHRHSGAASVDGESGQRASVPGILELKEVTIL